MRLAKGLAWRPEPPRVSRRSASGDYASGQPLSQPLCAATLYHRLIPKDIPALPCGSSYQAVVLAFFGSPRFPLHSRGAPVRARTTIRREYVVRGGAYIKKEVRAARASQSARQRRKLAGA
jgi:hypothetical protein